MDETQKVCPGCQKLMVPVPVVKRPESSEFYCPGCHRSERMPVPVAHFLNSFNRQQQQAA